MRLLVENVVTDFGNHCLICIFSYLCLYCCCGNQCHQIASKLGFTLVKPLADSPGPIAEERGM